MIRRAACLAVLLVVAGAQDDEVRRAADGVLETIARKGELSPEARPDPWLVAVELLDRGERDAALAFAHAASGADTEGLAPYLGSRSASLDDEAKKADPFERAKALLALGEERQSAPDLAKGAALAEQLGWLAAAARGFRIGAQIARRTFDTETMLRCWQGRHAVALKRGDRRGAAVALLNAGNGHVELGDYAQALEHYRRSQRLFAELSDVTGEAIVLASTARVHLRRGAYRRALALFERALEVARNEQRRGLEGNLLLDVADSQEKLGAHELALRQERDALAIFRDLGDRGGVARSLGNIGLSCLYLERYAEAHSHLGEALALFRDLGDRRSEAAALSNIAAVHRDEGKLEDAERVQTEALEIARSIGDLWIEVSAHFTLGQIHLLAGAPGKAETSYREGLRLAQQLASTDQLVDGYSGLAKVHLARWEYRPAAEDALRAIRRLTGILAGLDTLEGARTRERYAELFEVAAAAAAGTGDADLACTVLEAGRAGALLASLEGRDAIRSMIPPELRAREAEARRVEETARARFRAALASGNRAAGRERRAELDAASDRLEAALHEVQEQSRVAAAFLYPRPASLSEVQVLLRGADALAVYAVLEKEALVLLVRASSARVVRLGPSGPIRRVCGAQDIVRDAPPPDMAALRAHLVVPLELGDDVRRVLVSPVGDLFRVPFAMLFPGREVVYVPSGTTYGILKARESGPGRDVLAVGDPDYSGRALPGLPATRAEAKAVGDVVLVGKDATKAAFLEALGKRDRWRAVHLACHGTLDPERALHSGLELSAAGDRDGLLTGLDILATPLETDLVVLSACETGRGSHFRGEGLLGLTQALLLAGSPRVLVSQWKVDDDATRALMEKFYDLWRRKGLSTAAALRKAQEELRANEAWSHPYFWAAWQLWGLPE